jgi:hypothetical protein
LISIFISFIIGDDDPRCFIIVEYQDTIMLNGAEKPPGPLLQASLQEGFFCYNY